MAITRAAKGTVAAVDDPLVTITLASVAIAQGASVIAVILTATNLDGASAVEWNGLSLTRDEDRAATLSGVRLQVWSRHNCPAGTGDVVAQINTVETGAAVMSVVQLSTNGTLATDKHVSATGVGTAPSSGATATTAYADEMLIGAVGQNQGVLDVLGTWGGSFSDGQSVNDGATIALNDGYRLVSATGAYTAAKTGTTSAEWCAIIVTYYQATTDWTKSLSDSVTPTEAEIAHPTSARADSVTVTDAAAKHPTKAATDSVSATDALNTTGTFVRSLSDSAPVTDAAYAGLTSYAGLDEVGIIEAGGFTPIPTDPITGDVVDIPRFIGATAMLGLTTFLRNGKDPCPYLALTHDPKLPGWYAQGDALVALTFSVQARPMQFASADEVHYLFSLHEAKSGGQEILSFGVTPNGRAVVVVKGHGNLQSAEGAIVFDGRVYRADINHHTRPFIVADPNPAGPDVTKFSLNGVGIVSVLRYPSFGFPTDAATPKRFMFFNGIAGSSRIAATIYQCEFSFSSFAALSGNSRAIRWEFSEGHGATVAGREVRPESTPDPNVIPVDDGLTYGDEIIWDVVAQQYLPDLFGYPPTWEALPISPVGCYRRIVTPRFTQRSAGSQSYTPSSPAPIGAVPSPIP